MRWAGILITILVFIVVAMLVIYYFVPSGSTQFTPEYSSSNFSVDLANSKVQFYDNMRYPTNEISYRISEDCPLQKKANMEQAFQILEDKTILQFFPVNFGEEILVECEETVHVDNGLFIAGEGGPVNITISGNFNVIYNGRILLIRESKCKTPNVGLHELLHALGFDHSKNPSNIMYEVSNCDQTLGEDIPELINNLYSFKTLPDLTFENVSAFTEGRYLNANLSVRNIGLLYSEKTNIAIYADEKKIKEVEVDPLDIGYGTKLSLYNIWIGQANVNEIKFVIETSFKELDKTNNEVILEVKK